MAAPAVLAAPGLGEGGILGRCASPSSVAASFAWPRGWQPLRRLQRSGKMWLSPLPPLPPRSYGCRSQGTAAWEVAPARAYRGSGSAHALQSSRTLPQVLRGEGLEVTRHEKGGEPMLQPIPCGQRTSPLPPLWEPLRTLA